MPCSIQNLRIALSRVRERETVGGLRMGEVGLVEVEPEFLFLRPGDPVFELRDGERVAFDLLAVHLGVTGVQVEAMAAGSQRHGLLEVRAQFARRAGFAGIIAGDGEAAADRAAGVFEAADVIALPAVDGNGNAAQDLARLVGVDAEGGVTFFGELIGGFGGGGAGRCFRFHLF